MIRAIARHATARADTVRNHSADETGTPTGTTVSNSCVTTLVFGTNVFTDCSSAFSNVLSWAHALRSLCQRICSRRAGEATVREDSFEARIGSVRVPLRIDGQKYEMDVTHSPRFVQPLEHRVPLTEARIHEGHRERWHVALARHRFQRSQQVAGFAPASQLRQDVSS